MKKNTLVSTGILMVIVFLIILGTNFIKKEKDLTKMTLAYEDTPKYSILLEGNKITEHILFRLGGKKSEFRLKSQKHFIQVLQDNEFLWTANRLGVEIFNNNGKKVKELKFEDRPSIYKVKNYILVATQNGIITMYDRSTLELVKEIQINNYIWDVKDYNERIYVTSFSLTEDKPYLSIISNEKIKTITLGEGFSPTSIAIKGSKMYIAAYPLDENDENKILEFDLDNNKVVRSTIIEVFPSSLFINGNDLIVHEFNFSNGVANRLLYLDLVKGESEIYSIPNSMLVKQHVNGNLFLIEIERNKIGSIRLWNSIEKKIDKNFMIPEMEGFFIRDVFLSGGLENEKEY